MREFGGDRGAMTESQKNCLPAILHVAASAVIFIAVAAFPDRAKLRAASVLLGGACLCVPY